MSSAPLSPSRLPIPKSFLPKSVARQPVDPKIVWKQTLERLAKPIGKDPGGDPPPLITPFIRRMIKIGGAIGAFLVCVSLLVSTHREEYFPVLPPGSYVGTIDDVEQLLPPAEAPGPAGGIKPPTNGSRRTNSSGRTTLYAERLGNTNTVLIVVFAPEWKPQVLPLRPLMGQTASDQARPLLLRNGERSFQLSGSGSGSRYEGTVDPGDGTRGSWVLEPMSSDSLKSTKRINPINLDIKTWLTSRMEQRRLEEEFHSLQAEQDQQAEKIQRLERFIDNGEVLRDRSESRRTAIADEFNRLSAQRKKSTQELRSAMDDLGLLQRATARGQAVELARRIARRENKWFSVKWADIGTGADAEEQLARQNQIDPQKLAAALKRAEEIQRLRNSVAAEREKIADLERQLREQEFDPGRAREQTGETVRQPARPPKGSQPPVIQKEERPWWRVWDNFSG